MAPDQDHASIRSESRTLLREIGVADTIWRPSGLAARSPITGETIGHLASATTDDVAAATARSVEAFELWRLVPAPRRGELVRLLGEELRTSKAVLARLVTIEAGKIATEAAGEVQEMIDICDFAVGLSRQLHGLTIASERPQHRMMETWHPLGPVGIITSFNFPVAVWAWNAAIALVCGNPCLWKPSEKTPLTALATQALFERAAVRFGDLPHGLSQVLVGGPDVGESLAGSPRTPLVSATGSSRMGRAVAPRLATRFARAILELGGNNGAIVTPSADLDLALRAVAFAAMGTAGQRCTSLRRLFVHDSIHDAFVDRLRRVFGSVRVGDPRRGDVLVGPLIDSAAFEAMQAALAEARSHGAAITGGDRKLEGDWPDAFYVAPALVEIGSQEPVVRRETFAPILYVMRYRDLPQAIEQHNAVPQGLASAIFTRDLGEAEIFLSSAGSDCGIANVNIGPSGAEIGGAFGGEKDTGGGREAGSDCWKAYMRRATNTINYGTLLPLAQGVTFDVG